MSRATKERVCRVCTWLAMGVGSVLAFDMGGWFFLSAWLLWSVVYTVIGGRS